MIYTWYDYCILVALIALGLCGILLIVAVFCN